MVVTLWDAFIRGFHWLLVLVVTGLWLTGGNITYIDIHHKLGLVVLALLLTRIIWGFVGSESARFRTFLRGPRAMISHIRNPLKGTWLTHNPVGGWAVVLMILALLAQAITGLFTDDAIFFRGPLAHLLSNDWVRTLTSYHKQAFDWILILLAIHILANAIYSIKGKRLMEAMVTGKIESQEPVKQPKVVHGGYGFALLAFNLIWIFWWLG